MHGSHFSPTSSCSVCTQTDCSMSDGTCSEQAENERQIQGWLFSFVCTLVFLMPIVLAILGSMIFKNNQTYGLLAGLIGFILGGCLSAAFTRIARVEGR